MSPSELALKPRRFSSLYHKQESFNAKFVQDEHGWIRPERFNDPHEEKTRTELSVGIYDISHLIKLSLKSVDVAETLSKLFGNPTTTGTLMVNEPGTFNETICVALSNDEAIFVTNSPDVARKLDAGAERYQTTDVSSVLGGLYVMGGKSRAVLSKLTELNVNSEAFPNMRGTCASLHHVQCIVLRFDLRDLNGYQIYFERAYGEYLWESIFHAGTEFGAIPIGSSAMKLLGWRLG